MTGKKYEINEDGRIVALRDIPGGRGDQVRAGDLGGFISSEHNLSHYGSAWVYDNARVSNSARVSEHARVGGDAVVADQAIVTGYAIVGDDALVCHDAVVSESAQVYGKARICGDAYVGGYAHVYGAAHAKGLARIQGTALVSGTAILSGGVHIDGPARIQSNSDIIHIVAGDQNHEYRATAFRVDSDTGWAAKVGCTLLTPEEILGMAGKYQDMEDIFMPFFVAVQQHFEI